MTYSKDFRVNLNVVSVISTDFKADMRTEDGCFCVNRKSRDVARS